MGTINDTVDIIFLFAVQKYCRLRLQETFNSIFDDVDCNIIPHIKSCDTEK